MSKREPEASMSANKAENGGDQPDQQDQPPQAAAETEPDEATPAAGPEAPDGDERLAELEAEVAELKDQLLRALAETENVRRRAQRERADILKYAAAPILKDILTVADNLSRAVESAAQGDAAAEGRLETLLAGVKLTEKELSSAFERHHVVKLEPLGERLDPHRHEAMFEVPDPGKPGIVVQVVQAGYLLHDRLLRPARVGVSKSLPAQAPDTGDAAETPTETGEPGGRIDTSV